MKPPSSIRPLPPALPLESCLAKTRIDEDGVPRAGRTVEDHCRITGAVAACLLARLANVRPGLFPPHTDQPARVHDVGKVCPTFQAKLYDAVIGADARRRMRELSLANPENEQQWGGHAAVSYACLADTGAPSAVARIAGAHHGKAIEKQSASRPGYGGEVWQATRRELLKRLVGEEPLWPDLTGEALERAVCGLTITADWIASGPLFDDPDEDWRPLVEQAVDEAGFRWPSIRRGLNFEDIFPFAPRPAQRALFESVTGPGVYIMEAPMGLGKTEAALYAAYRMLESGHSGGLYFALPTQLTSNRIHSRVNDFLSRIFDTGGSALLLHGMAWLERFLRQSMGEEAAPNQAWFAHGKRGILAPFAVGTVDQALLSAMHVRHGALRTFGLAGKTVILDEVHSYDAYTGTILDCLVEQLRQIGCTVIILSATLTAARRRELTDMSVQNETSPQYPLISAAPVNGPCVSVPCESPAPARVMLTCHVENAPAVEEALLRAEQGQRVLWIENTVAEAQECFRLLAARASSMPDVPVGLLHSRFTPTDRALNEERWTTAFGPHAPGRGRLGCILVGTQVVEQSLDIDADFLITRFCPTDMLLQRLGRLWRHDRNTPRPVQSRREAWILHPALEEALSMPKTAFGPTGYVYSPYVLCRSLELWLARDAVTLPEDIRPLLEATYAMREEENAPLAAALQDLRAQREDLRGKALRSRSSATGVQNDDDPGTRLNQRKEVPVLLIRRWQAEDQRLILADGKELSLSPQQRILYADGNPHGGKNVRRETHQAVAAQLTLNMLRLPESAAPEALSPGWRKTLERWIYCGDLRVAKLDDDGTVRSPDGMETSRPAHYSSEMGYVTYK